MPTRQSEMQIGYLMNTYPVTSTTFIRREIQAIEKEGVPVSRFAVRRWSEPLVDARDREEQARTRYLLSGQVPRLLIGLVTELLTNPAGMARAVGTWWRLLRNAGGAVPHFAYLMEAVLLKRHCRQDRIDHIHTHFSTNSAAVALLCHRLGGPGYSFTAHGPDEFVDWGPSSLSLKAQNARFVVAITHFCKVQIARAAGMQVWDKVHVVRCGIDPAEFDLSAKPFDASSPFVTVGRLCPQKAQVLVVEAVAQVAKAHPGIRVEMIGDGESRADVEAAIARHGLEQNIILLGWQDNSAVREALARARALLLPSFAEGLPIVIMEAFGLGRPVISTFIAGIPELVDDECGWIIPAGSAEAIATAMTEALSASPDRLRQLGLEGRRRVEQRHDVGVNARNLLGLIRAAHKDAQPG